MIPATQAFIDAVEESSRTFRTRFLDSNGNVLNCNITALQIYTGGGGELPQPGAIFNSYITATAQNLTSNIYGQELRLQVGIVTGRDSNDEPTIEYIDIGYYTPTQTSTAGPLTTFTAIGRLGSKCNKPYKSQLSYPVYIPRVIEEIQTTAGVIVAAKGLDIPEQGLINEPITGLTCAEALAEIAGLLGGFVTEDYQGRIVIAAYNSGDSYAVNESRMKARPSFTESSYTVTGIACRVTEDREDEETGQLIPGTVYTYGTPNVMIADPYMTEDLFYIMSHRYTGLSFYPASVPLTLGNPRLEPWDMLDVTDSTGSAKTVPCHMIEHHFDGGYWQNISSLMTGNGDKDNEQVAGPTAKAIEKMNVDIFMAQQAILNRATINQLNAAIASIDTGYIGKAIIGNAEITDFTATKGDIESLLANQFTADEIQTVLLNFDNAVGSSLKLDDLQSKRSAFEELLTGSFTASEVEAISAVFAEASATSLITQSLSAQYAQISFANIGTETVSELFCNVGLIENAVIQDGKITGTLAGVRVVADIVEANTVIAGDLLVKDPNDDKGTYYKINLSESEITADELPAEAMVQYLSGNNIVAHSITARHITADDIMGTNGWINLSEGTFEYLNPEKGTGCSWDGNEFRILSGSGSGSLPIVAAWIDTDEDEFSSTWLTNSSGSTITPAANTIYLIQNNDGPHKHKYFIWNGARYADADLFGEGLDSAGLINAAVTAADTAAKTSSIRYEGGVLILADSTSAFSLRISNQRLSFYQAEKEVAYISNNQLFIPYTVVLNAMDVGPWRWMKQEDNNLTLQWIGG